ncbi:MAG: transketolase [Firmicutes bacterium]|nr:transketolase [Bacillota bacterium]
MMEIAQEQRAWVQSVQAVAAGIRRRVLEHTIRNNGGYLSQACSAAETLAVLYTRVLRIGQSAAPLTPAPFSGVPGTTAGGARGSRGALYNGRPEPAYDRFFFSPAHYALVLYATLIETGRMSEDALAQFNRDGSTVEMIGAEHSPGMEVTSGSLAQGLSQAAGVAIARARRGDTGRCVVYMSDGEFQEGQTWETLAAMAHHRVGNVLVYVDVNGQQCDGRMQDVLDIGDLPAKLRAFGAIVHDVDGHDPAALAKAGEPAVNQVAPTVVLARTCPWQGLPALERRAPRLHYVRFRDADEVALWEAELARLREER